MNTPLFSIIIPTLNEEMFLPKLLASLSAQTDKQFEVIVCDGKSKDKTITAAKQFSRKLPRLKIINSPVRCLPDQRNFGAKNSTGSWLIFMDADNIALPYFIERVAEFVKTQKPQVFTTWCTCDSNLPNDALITQFTNMLIDASILFKRPFTPGPLTIVRRNVFNKVGGFTNGLSWGEDYDFGKKVCDTGVPLQVLRETLYIWSMRRLRHEGTLKTARQFVKTIFYILITKRGLTKMRGYDMGGHLYSKKKKVTLPVLKRIDLQLRKLMKEIFE